MKWRDKGRRSTGISARLFHFCLPSVAKFPFLTAFVARCWQVSSRAWPPRVLPQFCALPRHAPPPLRAPCVSRFVALHAYSAHGPEELDLQKGEGIKVLGKYQDGWLRGLSLVTGRAGIFPSDYVIPVFRYISRALAWVGQMMDSGPFQSKSLEIAFAFASH